MTKRKAKPSNETLKALEALMALPVPSFDLNKLRAAMVEHDKTCALCRLNGFLPRR